MKRTLAKKKSASTLTNKSPSTTTALGKRCTFRLSRRESREGEEKKRVPDSGARETSEDSDVRTRGLIDDDNDGKAESDEKADRSSDEEGAEKSDEPNKKVNLANTPKLGEDVKVPKSVRCVYDHGRETGARKIIQKRGSHE